MSSDGLATGDFNARSGSLAAQGQQILSAMGSGALSPSQATTMLQAIAAQSRIIETDELEQRVKKLEEGC